MIILRWAVTIESNDDDEAVRRRLEAILELPLRSDGYLTRGGVRLHVFVAVVEVEPGGPMFSRQDFRRVCDAISLNLSVSGPIRVMRDISRFAASPRDPEPSADGVQRVTLTVLPQFWVRE